MTQFVPYNRYAHAPRSAGGAYYTRSKALTAGYSAPVVAAPAFATFQHHEKAITFHNIANPNLLRIEAPAMEHGAAPLKMKLLKNNARANEYRLELSPEGNTHRLTASYGGHTLRDFPITLAPKAPQVQVTNPSGEIKISNVYKPHELGVHTTMPYSATIDQNNVATLNYSPVGTQNLEITYQGKTVPGGHITLAPHPDRLRAQQAMAYRQLPYGLANGPNNQFVMQPGFQPYAMPAAPAHCLNAAPMQTPMMPAQPMLMAPRAMPGYQPMQVQQQPLQAQGPPVKPGYAQVML